MCVRDGARHRKCHACRAISAMPATQDEAGCNQVPRLPRETKVHVAKCHACHAKCHDVTGDQNGPKRATQCHKCHACHAKTRWLSPQVPRLRRKTKAYVAKCHTCHAKLGGITGDQARPSAPPEPAQCHKCHVLQKTKVDVFKCHACHAKHAKCRGVTGDQTRPNAPAEPAQCHKCHACHAKPMWLSPSATPATQNDGGCLQVPRLPRKTRKVPRRHWRPSAPKRASRASPVPKVPRLPRETKVAVSKCHACHPKRKHMSPSATPVT